MAGIFFAPTCWPCTIPPDRVTANPSSPPSRTPAPLRWREACWATDLAVAQPQHGDGAYAGIRLTDVVGAMSHALDLAEGQPMGHSVRTTMIGMRIASMLGLDEVDSSALFYALLLKDLGCSTNSAQLTTLYGGDDRALKHAHRLIDWTDRVDIARYTMKHSRRDTFGSRPRVAGPASGIAGANDPP